MADNQHLARETCINLLWTKYCKKRDTLQAKQRALLTTLPTSLSEHHYNWQQYEKLTKRERILRDEFMAKVKALDEPERQTAIAA